MQAIMRIIQPAWPRAAHLLGIISFASGAVFWGVLLLTPLPMEIPPTQNQALARGTDTKPIGQWFMAETSHLRVSVIGLISSGVHGSALLSVNGGQPKAYQVGQILAPRVTLASVSPDSISIAQNGLFEKIDVAKRSPEQTQWFIPVSRKLDK